MLGIFGFAITHTSVTCSLVGNVLSTFVIPGNAVLDYEPLRNVAFFFGVYGVNFLMVLMALFPPYLYRKWKILGSRYTTNAMTYFTIGFIVCFVVTGFVSQSQYLYQVNGSDLVRPSIQVSCINAQSIEYQTAEWYTMWNQTHLRILKGDAIVMMTEEALLLRSDQQVDNAIALAKSIVTESPVSEGALLGLTYAIFEPGESKGMNRFVLISSDNGGTILWNYVKAHPVPIVENNITAGKPTIPTASSPYGKLGGAICFDLDFPQYIAQAGRSKVDLFLQPSWTWNAILTRHFEGDALRAIENGFTLFRCSSVGESGIVDPYGKFLSRQITGTDPTQLSVFLLPLQPHINTVFVYFGFIFEYICIAASAFAYIVVISTFFDYKWNIFES
jgi:apolipoprotein N-acyltransferase